MQRGYTFVPHLLNDAHDTGFGKQLMKELSEANPILAKFATTELKKITDETEYERTMLAALIGLKILGLGNKKDPDYVEVSMESIEQAQKQTFSAGEFYLYGTAFFWVREDINGLICGLNDIYGIKEGVISPSDVLRNLKVLFGAYKIEKQKQRKVTVSFA